MLIRLITTISNTENIHGDERNDNDALVHAEKETFSISRAHERMHLTLTFFDVTDE